MTLKHAWWRLKARPGAGMRDELQALLDSGKLSMDLPVSSVLDSLDQVELIMAIEELPVKPTVPILTVGDLLWLLKAIEFQKGHGKNAKQL